MAYDILLGEKKKKEGRSCRLAILGQEINVTW